MTLSASASLLVSPNLRRQEFENQERHLRRKGETSDVNAIYRKICPNCDTSTVPPLSSSTPLPSSSWITTNLNFSWCSVISSVLVYEEMVRMSMPSKDQRMRAVSRIYLSPPPGFSGSASIRTRGSPGPPCTAAS